MPVKRDSLDPKNSTTITLYRKSEILTEMRKYKHLHIHDIKNRRMWYVGSKVRGELEAVVRGNRNAAGAGAVTHGT